MNLSFSNRGWDMTWPELMVAAQEMHFNGIELYDLFRTPELIDKTLEETKKFAEEHYPGFDYKAFACHSWLVDPQLDELLNPESNIVKFRQRFHSMTCKSSGKDVFNFIFNLVKQF